MTKNKPQMIFNGRAVSRGIGFGKALCLHGQKRQFYKARVETANIDKEIARFRASVRFAANQLKRISDENRGSVGENQANIFETHLMFLEDKSLLSKIESTIRLDKVNAEWAVKTVSDSYIGRYKKLSDKHLREKYIDLEDVAERILTSLGGEKKSDLTLAKDTIVVAKEINPSTLIELSQSNPAAIITENGGWTSHAFILARELGIPAVTGIRRILRRVETGDSLMIDGFLGTVTLNPDDTSFEPTKRGELKQQAKSSVAREVAPKAVKTLDGFEVTIRANIDLLDVYETAASYGAAGIGLFRSEFLFNQNRGFPTEEEQFACYSEIAKKVEEHGVRIRTFDLGVDQLADQNVGKEKNPALGLTSIRLSLKYESEFRVQLRALLRASHKRHIDILIPMVSDVSEIVRVREILEEERSELESKAIPVGSPGLGAMIEIPAAVLIIDKIAEEVDFVSLGTNDLVQYLLAVDRDNENVADWFRTLHPAVLRSIKIVLDACGKINKRVIVCGEMAGSPLYAVILVGLGASDLSMNLNSIPRVRNVISKIAYEEAREIIKELEFCRTSDEVEDMVRKQFSSRWEHLFDPDSLPY